MLLLRFAPAQPKLRGTVGLTHPLTSASQHRESTVSVAPTPRSARVASFRPEVLVDGNSSLVLVEQLGAVDVQCLGRQVGQLSIEELWSVDEALSKILGLR